MTTNLDDFGYMELDAAAYIFKAVADYGYPKDFEIRGVVIAFNPESAIVFLTNDDGQMLVDNADGRPVILKEDDE